MLPYITLLHDNALIHIDSPSLPPCLARASKRYLSVKARSASRCSNTSHHECMKATINTVSGGETNSYYYELVLSASLEMSRG